MSQNAKPNNPIQSILSRWCNRTTSKSFDWKRKSSLKNGNKTFRVGMEKIKLEILLTKINHYNKIHSIYKG